MLQQLISTKAIQTIALVGISKNSGKTTLLNGIVKRYPELKWAVLSTGLDGETQDRLFKTPKPTVLLPAGTLFCADTPCLEGHGSQVSILKGELFSGRKLWLLRAEQDLATQITGPSNVKDQSRLARELLALGAEKVLIDGSLDRKSIAFEDTVKAIILCIGASFGSKEEIVEEIKRLALMIDIKSYPFSVSRYRSMQNCATVMYRQRQRWYKTELDSLINRETELKELLTKAPDALYIPTSYTSLLHASFFPIFKAFKGEIIFRHPQSLSLSYTELYKFRCACELFCLIPFRVKLYALNPWAIGKTAEDANRFRSYIRINRPQQDFIDIMELA